MAFKTISVPAWKSPTDTRLNNDGREAYSSLPEWLSQKSINFLRPKGVGPTGIDYAAQRVTFFRQQRRRGRCRLKSVHK